MYKMDVDECLVLSCLLLIISFDQVCGLSCYNCLSEDEQSCMKSERLQPCESHLRQPQCLTIRFTRIVHNKRSNKEVEETFKKKCVSGEFSCAHWCMMETMRNAEKCFESCCEGDGCNKSKKRKVIISRRSDMNNNATSEMKKFDKFIFFLLSALLFIIHNII